MKQSIAPPLALPLLPPHPLLGHQPALPALPALLLCLLRLLCHALPRLLQEGAGLAGLHQGSGAAECCSAQLDPPPIHRTCQDPSTLNPCLFRMELLTLLLLYSSHSNVTERGHLVVQREVLFNWVACIFLCHYVCRKQSAVSCRLS